MGRYFTGDEKDPEENGCLQSVQPWRQEPGVESTGKKDLQTFHLATAETELCQRLEPLR